MVQDQKGNRLGPTRYLHLVSSVHLLHLGHLHQLPSLEMSSGPGLKPNPARTSALPWQLPCSSSSLSRTRKLGPLSAARTHLLWMLWPGHSPLHPGLQILRLHHQQQLRPQQDWGLLLLPLQHSSLRTRTSAFPMELTADPQSPTETDLGILGQIQQSWPEEKGRGRMQRDTYTL
ncbi:hypothetical protein EPR50_G00160340 [Perca flavescens]|uniref:Uncharacterized protein n=1 Tax=Perca flavescens TaxID=8167 RepID=A0A484CMS1_PERFV|nr:hypothetical protein EPR50_G00160340 [Perca flavescens]